MGRFGKGLSPRAAAEYMAATLRDKGISVISLHDLLIEFAPEMPSLREICSAIAFGFREVGTAQFAVPGTRDHLLHEHGGQRVPYQRNTLLEKCSCCGAQRIITITGGALVNGRWQQPGAKVSVAFAKGTIPPRSKGGR